MVIVYSFTGFRCQKYRSWFDKILDRMFASIIINDSAYWAKCIQLNTGSTACCGKCTWVSAVICAGSTL